MKYIKPWKQGKLRVSENGRYLRNGEQPFFYLGDTAWLLCPVCDEEEAKLYLTNRRDKGFNVIQTVLIHRLPEMPATNPAEVEKDPTDPAYWSFVDRVMDIAEELGLYMALLPAWGHVVKEVYISEENIDRYVTFLANRYGSRPNVIWLLGGDIRGDQQHDLYCREGRLFKQLNPDKLVCYHPFGRTSSSLWFHDEPWLDFNMFQSGHRRYDQVTLGAWDDNRLDAETYFGEDNWRYVDRDYAMTPVKPTLDGEPSYEQILQGLHDLSQPYWREWDVRRYAYWSVFQGSMGHTYGDNSIQQFFHTPTIPGSFGVRYTWQDSLHHVGSEQMGILKDLMESVDYQSGHEATALLLSPQGKKYRRISVFAGNDFLFAYTYLGEAFTLSLTPYAGRRLTVSWFNPVSGRESFLMDATGKESIAVKPVKRFTPDNDWVLVVRAE